MSSDVSSDCFHDREAVKPYADISGSGVLVGFLGTAYLSIFILIIYYLVAFDVNEGSFRAQGSGSGPGPPANPTSAAEAEVEPSSAPDCSSPLARTPWKTHPIDRRVLNVLRPKLLKIFSPRWRHFLTKDERLHRAFQNCISAMCDIQMVTGTGILSSGYHAVTNNLSAYHWQVIMYLAWFSHLTHLTGLTCLRRYLQKDASVFEKRWRMIMMMILTLMLTVGMIPTGFFTFTTIGINDFIKRSNLSVPLEPSIANASAEARCFFDLTTAQQRLDLERVGDSGPVGPRALRLDETLAFSKMMVSVMLASLTFIFRMGKLIKPASKFTCELRNRLSNFWVEKVVLKYARFSLSRLTNSHKPPDADWKPAFFCQALIAIPVCAELYLDLFFCVGAEIFWLVVAATWGSIQLFKARSTADVDEGEWTFGQILPIFLFLLPLLPLTQEAWAIVSSAPARAADSGENHEEHTSAATYAVRLWRMSIALKRARDGPRQPLMSGSTDEHSDNDEGVEMSDMATGSSTARVAEPDPSETPVQRRGTGNSSRTGTGNSNGMAPGPPPALSVVSEDRLVEGLKQYLERDIYTTQKHIDVVLIGLILSAFLLSGMFLGPISGNNPDLVGVRLLLSILIVVFYQVQFFYYLVLISTRVSVARWPFAVSGSDEAFRKAPAARKFVWLGPGLFVVAMALVGSIAIFPLDMEGRMQTMCYFWAVFFGLLCLGVVAGFAQDVSGRTIQLPSL